MEEKDIIKQLKILKNVKPNKDWVFLAKQNILNNNNPNAEFKKPSHIVMVMEDIVSAFERRAIVFVTIGFIGLLSVVGLLYFNSKQINVAYNQVENLLAKVASQSESSQDMLISLGELQGKLEGINMALDNLKNAKDSNQALAMAQVVRLTANEGKQVVEKVKKSDKNLSKQVLASLVSVETMSNELEAKSAQIQKTIFENYIQDLKKRNLSSEDKKLLEKAENYYKNGKENEAMLLIARIK